MIVQSRELKTGEEYHRKFKHIQADREAEIESMRVSATDTCVRTYMYVYIQRHLFNYLKSFTPVGL